ncbi:hypothetical protein CPHO_11540 [Corynebacterium phocae]|uniref:Fumarylacetoacetase-like C-terminal domain-containing protein n=1 Tax=Corynebacterium phocae TaxID=161895 RepID=A0A1L7D5S0_9CORY|nr:fumarylacetoacetate hydrolase family protein [Corynebacterium phocae]APT93417.1 hypothetical protein CPHO_11540 [Corynebacterium phocae]KAA8721110.1 fumarylacetoacetate hydrolase family protein [Corynebacterium phocae]
MKIARISTGDRTLFARVADGFHVLDATDLVEAATAAETGEVITDAKLLSPVTPSKVVAMGCAFLAEDRPFDPETDREPFYFLKPPSAIVGPGQPIEVPEVASGAIFECELAAVIGSTCKAVSADNALDYVLGYTVCNDMSAPALMNKDGQWSRGKGLDTFCPVGPYLETELANPDDTAIKAHLIRQGKRLNLVDSTTARQIWSVAQSIAYCSQYMTLEPGDVISMGCPPGPIPVEHGDEVVIEIEGVGTLANPVLNF